MTACHWRSHYTRTRFVTVTSQTKCAMDLWRDDSAVSPLRSSYPTYPGPVPHAVTHLRARWHLYLTAPHRLYPKRSGTALPCKKEFAGAHVILDSYPPVPLSTWKGGTHSSGFSSYEGAARGSRRLPKRKKAGKPASGFPAFFVSARSTPAACISLFYSCSRFAIVYD